MRLRRERSDEAESMIYISYGMLKSASTMLYQLTEEVFRFAGRQPLHLGPPFRERLSVTNYFDTIDAKLLEAIEKAVGHADIVLKTHQPPHPDVVRLIRSGEILANAAIRDPREIALSMLDHGHRSRRWRIAEFSEFWTVADCFASIDDQIATFHRWQELGNVKIFIYNDICFRTEAVATAIARQSGFDVVAQAPAQLFRDKSTIGQFSKGVPLRYREMAEAESQLFLSRYANFYREFTFDTPEGQLIAAMPNRIRSPRGQFAQEMTRFKRLLRYQISRFFP